jgi:signal transduction histidine kinase/HPt (histidine-containing phosphotransfer) domain-containing protein
MVNRKFQILVVEDDELDRLIIKKALKSASINHDLHFAEDHESGKIATDGKEYDCIFLDYNLPGGTGLELLKEIRATGNQSPIIIVTSQGDEKIAVEAMKNGANDYIPKNLLTGDGIAQSVRYMVNMKENEKRQRELEFQLIETQHQLNAVVANAPIILFALNVVGEIRLFEGKGLNELNIEKEKIINQPLQNFSEQIPIQIENFEKALSGQEVTVVVEWENKFFEIFYNAIRDKDDRITGVIGVAADVTAHKRIQEELQIAKQMAEDTAKVKENFLANMSHEIRTPMNGIIGLTRILLNTQLNEEQKGFLSSIKMCSDNLMVIINDILDFSKIEAGKMTFEEVPFNLRESIKHTIELFQVKADEKKVELVSQIDNQLPEYFKGDPTRLLQILNNLVSNAIKFTEKGEVRVFARMAELNGEKARITFEVRDSGIGIPEKSIDSIFESFTQASSDTTRKFGGTGLGLTIVKKLVELQGGTIDVKSKQGAGTSFIFSIEYPVQESVQKAAKKEEVGESISHLKILIAEDNKINQLVVRKVFSDWKTEVEFADNGQQAVEKASSKVYDLILMDIQMPIMDGLTASKTIRTTLSAPNCNIPIMAMTAHATAQEKQKCIDHGMNDHINKPFELLELKKKIVALTQSRNSALKEAQIGVSEQINPEVKINKPTPAATVNKQEAIENFLNAPKINLNYLKQIADGNEGFVIEMIEMFLNKTPEAMKEMNEHYHNRNWEEFKKIAHRIKPSFGYMGMPEIQQSLSKLEQLTDKELMEEEVEKALMEITTRTNFAYSQLRVELTSMK